MVLTNSRCPINDGSIPSTELCRPYTGLYEWIRSLLVGWRAVVAERFCLVHRALPWNAGKFPCHGLARNGSKVLILHCGSICSPCLVLRGSNSPTGSQNLAFSLHAFVIGFLVYQVDMGSQKPHFATAKLRSDFCRMSSGRAL